MRDARLAFSARTAELLRLGGYRFVVTGARGWLGQTTLEMLRSALDKDFPARVAAFGSQSRELVMRGGGVVNIIPLCELASLAPAPTVLLHYAFVTKDRVAGMPAGEFFRVGEEIADHVARAIPLIGVERMLFPSSGAVYGLPTRQDHSTREEPDANPYGTQKLRDEQRFAVMCEKHGIRLAIPRIFNISGPLINKHDAYVLSSFINAVLAGRPIELRARRRVVRAFVAVRDLLDATFGWLVSGDVAEQLLFDTGGEALEAGELARRVASRLGHPDLPVRRPPLGPEPDDVYLGDGRDLEQLAKNQDIKLASLDQQIDDTAAYLRELR